MIKRLSIVLIAISTAACSGWAQKKPDPEKALASAKKQIDFQLKNFKDTNRFPRSTRADTLFAVPSRDWTSGFYPGILWYMYEYTNDKNVLTAAQTWTQAMEKEQFNTTTHDLGFMLYCSYGNGLRLTKDKSYEKVLLQGAKSLCTRFSENTGVIQSWDHGKWQFPVIIDNMMNLELLFWATKVSGDSSFYNIAVTHALTTLKNHFRADNSSYHVLDYDTITGNVIARVTHQGFADESAWARGQAWGLYGYTVTYRETKDKRFLDQAVKIADFFLGHPNLPEDKVPYWDFNAPNIPNEERDASAAAIAASGMLELSTYLQDGSKYFNAAQEILSSLSGPNYQAKPGSNNGFVLMHSTGHKPAKSEMDVPLIYADYYFIEGLLRYKDMVSKNKKRLANEK